jgi:ketosteroid isomerase-like protein
MVAALAAGVAVNCDEYVAPDYLDHQGRAGRPLHGPEGFRQVVEAAHRTAKPHLEVQDTIADSTHVVARIRWRFEPRHAGDHIERETIEIVRVEGGRAVEHWGAEAWSRTLPAEAARSWPLRGSP